MRTPTRRKLATAVLASAALIGAVLSATSTTASAGGPDPITPTVTRIALGGIADAEMLAPDGAGKVWFALPGTQTYGYVSGGAVTSLSHSVGDEVTGAIATLGTTPYIWVEDAFMMMGAHTMHLTTGSAGDSETDVGVASSLAFDLLSPDMTARAGVGVWTAITSPCCNYGYAIGHGGTCATTFCNTPDDPEYSSVAIDDAGNVWGADGAQQWDATENIRKLVPGTGTPAATEFNVTSKVATLAWSGNSLFGSVPGQSILRQIIPGTAPNVTEIDYGVSGVVGDVEADDDGNIWFSIAGQPKIGVLANGSIQEFTIPAPARRLAFDASIDRVWWSESGTAKVAYLSTAQVFPPTTTTTTAAPTTTTTAPAPTTTAPASTPMTTPPPAAPADTTAPTAALTGTTLRLDRNGTIRPVFGPASEPMAVIAQLRIRGVPVTMGGTLMPPGDTRPVALNVPRRLWPRTGRTVAATLVVATIDGARNVGLSQLPVTLTR